MALHGKPHVGALILETLIWAILKQTPDIVVWIGGDVGKTTHRGAKLQNNHNTVSHEVLKSHDSFQKKQFTLSSVTLIRLNLQGGYSPPPFFYSL